MGDAARAERDTVLNAFPTDLALLLVEFAKYISTLEVDYIVIMARKALRLYDLLLLAGGPIATAPVLSDHVLDEDLQIFSGKRVALVDDTLILGTTLGEAKRKLELVAANVTCHVFAADSDNWSRELILPDKVFTTLDHNRMRSFCAIEVAALAAVAIPYLSDFPVSELVKFSANQLLILHSLPGWETHTLTTPSQSEKDVAVYTMLPKRDTEDQLRIFFGDALFDLIEITKIRVFCRKIGNFYWTRVVPIVTMGPIQHKPIAELFSQTLQKFEGQSVGQLDKLRKFLTSEKSQLRFIQYALSAIAGTVALNEIYEISGQKRPTTFDLTEAVRLFGPWLRNEFKYIHSTVPLAFDAANGRWGPQVSGARTELPTEVYGTTKAEFEEFIRPAGQNTNQSSDTRPSLFTDLVRAFIGLYQKHELPARLEAKHLGAALFDASPTDAPHRDRLKFGFAWRALAECLLKREALTLNPRLSNRLSLILDYLIDMGIAVPILCNRNGVIFRAYRYGEGVEFGDHELALAHELLKRFAEESNLKDLPRLVVEKLLASLLHVGVAKQFLTVVHGQSGADGLARIGFHLHGAVAVRSQRFDTIFADEQDTWLSGYLVDRGTLERETGSARYKLGTAPEAAFPNPNSLTEAAQLGRLMAMLSSPKAAGGKPVLDSSDLIVLASCPQPRLALAAVAAELRLFANWYDRFNPRLEQRIDFSVRDSVHAALSELKQSMGYLALNSARLKLQGYKESRPQIIVQNCARYLRELPNGQFLATHFLSDWEPVLASASDEERTQFDPWIATIATLILDASVSIFVMEIALASLESRHGGSGGSLREALGKADSYIRALESSTNPDAFQLERRERLKQIIAQATPLLDAESDYRAASAIIRLSIGAMRTTASHAEIVFNQFGQKDKRTNYLSVLWYDIIDSTGQKSGLKGNALFEYRGRVRAFKSTIARDITALERAARSAKTIVFPFQGGTSSQDDEKHIFVAGPRHLSVLSDVTKTLLQRAKVHGICVRTIAIRTDFAGGPAYKYETDPDVKGETFWEHFSRLRPQVKEAETRLGSNKPGAPPRLSFFWVAGDLIGSIPLPRDFVPDRKKHTFKTEIESVVVEIDVQGGVVDWPRTEKK